MQPMTPEQHQEQAKRTIKICLVIAGLGLVAYVYAIVSASEMLKIVIG